MSRSPETPDTPDTPDRPGSCAGHRVRQGGQAPVEADNRRLLRPKGEDDGVNDFILDRPRRVLTGDRRPTSSSLAGKPAEVGKEFLATIWDPPAGINIKKELVQEDGVSPKSSPKLLSPINIEELIAKLDMIAADIYTGWPARRSA